MSNAPVGHWRASYLPGDWVVLAGPTSLVVLPPAPISATQLINDLWDEVLGAASLGEVVSALAHYQVSEMANLGAFFWADGQIRSLVRGVLRVVDPSNGNVVAAGPDVITWSEVGLGELRRVRIEFPGNGPDAGPLPLVVGAVRAGAVFLDASAVVTTNQQLPTTLAGGVEVAAEPAGQVPGPVVTPGDPAPGTPVSGAPQVGGDKVASGPRLLPKVVVSPAMAGGAEVGVGPAMSDGPQASDHLEDGALDPPPWERTAEARPEPSSDKELVNELVDDPADCADEIPTEEFASMEELFGSMITGAKAGEEAAPEAAAGPQVAPQLPQQGQPPQLPQPVPSPHGQAAPGQPPQGEPPVAGVPPMVVPPTAVPPPPLRPIPLPPVMPRGFSAPPIPGGMGGQAKPVVAASAAEPVKAGSSAPSAGPANESEPTEFAPPCFEASNQVQNAGRLLAVFCPQQHPNAPQTQNCRLCQAPIPAQEPCRIARPVLAVLRTSSGAVVPVDRTILIGRNPAASRLGPDQQPHLLVVPSPGQDVSRTHLQVSPDDWKIVVTDLFSTNGTTLIRPHQGPERLAPGEAAVVELGTVVELVDGVRVVVDRP